MYRKYSMRESKLTILSRKNLHKLMLDTLHLVSKFVYYLTYIYICKIVTTMIMIMIIAGFWNLFKREYLGECNFVWQTWWQLDRQRISATPAPIYYNIWCAQAIYFICRLISTEALYNKGACVEGNIFPATKEIITTVVMTPLPSPTLMRNGDGAVCHNLSQAKR